MRADRDFRLPGRFATLRLARRDRDAVTAAPPAPPGDLLAAHEAAVRALITHPDTPPAASLAGLAWLGGEHTAPGGGAVLAALDRVIEWDETTAGVVDDWIGAHGLAFTAAAVAESAALEAQSTRGATWLGEATEAYRVGRLSGAQVRVRQAIAAAPDCAEAEAALEERRTAGQWQRVAASLMAPHRLDWVDEDCADPRDGALESLAASISTPAQRDLLMPRLEQAAIPRDPILLATFVDGLREAAAAPLAAWYDRVRGDSGRTVHRNLLTMLAAIPGDEAFRLLLARADRPDVTPVLARVAARVPRRALRLLALEGGTAEAAAVLRERVAADPALAAEVAATLPAEAAGRLRPPPAGTDLLPSLVLPAVPRARAAGRTDGLRCPDPAGERWLPGEREAWLSLAPVEITRSHLDDGEPPRGARSDREQAVVARFGLEALSMALRLARQQPDALGVLLLPFHGPEVAAVIAGWLEHTGSARLWARLWLDRHAHPAARALIPAAAGRPGVPREEALRALRLLDPAVVETARAGYGVALPLAAADRPIAPPPLPAWAAPETLPPIKLRDGGELPATSVTTLLTALSLTRYAETPPHPQGSYLPSTGRAEPVESAFAPQPLIARDTAGAPVTAAARAMCEPDALAAFGQALLDRWIAARMPAADAWVLIAQVHLADDDAVRRLAALIRPWPARGRHVRAGDGVAVLGTLATDAPGPALWELDRLAADSGSATSLRERATAYLRMAAAAHGWTPAQVPHRAAPSFAPMELDYGPRRFTAGVGEHLEARVLDTDGRPMRTLPRPTARDDAAAVALARERFARLRRELRPEAARQARYLEQAMINGVRWPAAELTGFLIGHPLSGPFARRLLWASYTPDGHVRHVVRVCEDGTLADVADHPAVLDPGAPIGVAHPADLGADLPRWAELLADYGIGQPFAQLGRARFPLTPAEREATVLTRPAATDINPSRLGPFMRRGWRSAPAGFGSFVRDAPGGLELIGSVRDDRLSIRADERGTIHWGRPPRIRLGTLPPAAVEEAIRDLTAITAA